MPITNVKITLLFQIVDSRTFAEVDSNFMYTNKYNYCEKKVAFKMILSEYAVFFPSTTVDILWHVRN